MQYAKYTDNELLDELDETIESRNEPKEEYELDFYNWARMFGGMFDVSLYRDTPTFDDLDEAIEYATELFYDFIDIAHDARGHRCDGLVIDDDDETVTIDLIPWVTPWGDEEKAECVFTQKVHYFSEELGSGFALDDYGPELEMAYIWVKKVA